MKDSTKFNDRFPAVAGKFYPSDPDLLENEIIDLYASAMHKQCHQVRALISPHAGYVFSGGIAASAFNQINPDIKYKRVFILASSHYYNFGKAAIYCDGDFLMPYGKDTVDTNLGILLAEQYPDLFTADPNPHQNEHSIEVQLPFLHYKLKSGYSIVPIIIGTNNIDTIKQIASVLKPYLQPENLFVVSTDFSHYPEINDARKVDEITKQAIISNKPDGLLKTLNENIEKNIPHLSTSLCGWTSVLTLMYMSSTDKMLKYHAIEYTNSGNAEYYGQQDRVVGYWAIVLSSKHVLKSDFQLSAADEKILLNIARKTLEGCCKHERSFTMDTSEFSDNLKTECGAFVTLHKEGRLRGCIGRLVGNLPLYRLIHEMTISAAMHDPRFLPVESDEINELSIEISVLSPLKKIKDVDEIILGTHGIYIENGYHNGVYLPQVATETGWNREQFLGHCAHDKAGLAWDGWKMANVYTFTATVFSEE